MTSSQAQDPPAQDRPPLRVINGDASAEDIAAVVAVLAATSNGNGDPGPTRRTSRWADPATRMRPAHSHGAGAWRSSALPH